MVSPWRFRPGARSTSTTCVSVDFRHATSARRLPSFAVTANSVGGVASYLNSWEALPTLPALSVHEPVSDARGLSGPAYCEAAEHEAIPDVGSVPENERMIDSGSTMLQFSVTVPRHHPFAGLAGE